MGTRTQRSQGQFTGYQGGRGSGRQSLLMCREQQFPHSVVCHVNNSDFQSGTGKYLSKDELEIPVSQRKTLVVIHVYFILCMWMFRLHICMHTKYTLDALRGL